METNGINGSSKNGQHADNRTFIGSLIPCQTLQVVKYSFTDASIITLRNPGDASIYMAWLAATADEHPPGSAIDVCPGEVHTIKPSQLGSLENKCLLIHNTSSVKKGNYVIEVTG